MCVCVCVCVCVASVALSVRELHLENGNIRNVEVVGSRTSTNVISLAKKFTHNCLCRLRSIYEYLDFELDRWLGRTLRSIRVRLDLRSSPAAAPKSVPFDALATHQGVRQRGLNSE